MKKWLCGLMVVMAVGTMVLADEAKKPEMVELKGTLGCGHCQFHKTSSCAAALKTADGKIYVIDNATPAITAAREAAAPANVAGTVTEKNGVLHIQATKQELVK
ncbi:MAG: hypothetical protein WCH84_00740 [Verrucomicrobiota bacterium]